MLSASNKKMYITLLAIATITLQVVAIATPDWAVQTIGGNKENWGLWKLCGAPIGSAKQVCNHLPPKGSDNSYPKNSLEAARAFAVLGPVLVAISLGSMYLYSLSPKLQRSLLLAGSLSSIIALIIFSAELLKYKTGTSQMNGSPGYSFYLNLSGAVLGLITAYVAYQM